MTQKVLVTGGAGFIGSYIVDALIARGCQVRVIDSLVAQVHPEGPPDYLNPEAEYLWEDLRNEAAVDRALRGIDVVVHQAAMVGVGQSMFCISEYISANVLSTATLLNAIVNRRHTISKIVMASSMSVYGEGLYACPECGPVRPPSTRSPVSETADWEQRCSKHNHILRPVPIDESAKLLPASVYAISKRDQEDLCLTVGHAYRIPTIAFRYFGVYGRRQALSNPYAGLMAMFASRLVNNKAPLIFEDGLQIRDFIHVTDVAAAVILGVERDSQEWEAYNLGNGRPTTIRYVAETLARFIRTGIEPEILGKYRKGDIRHCYGSTTKIEQRLGFKPQVSLDDGLLEVASWAMSSVAEDYVDAMRSELIGMDLLV
jgi:dTDP-L-rhamnose 4-epimerase